MAREHCDPEEYSQVLYTEQIKDLANDDVLVFLPPKGKAICMSKSELMQFWDQETGWNWGNCHDNNGNPVTDEQVDLGSNAVAAKYCNKYYKVPATNQVITDMMRDTLRDSNTQVWTITDSGERRMVGRGMHYQSEYNNPNEKIYKICPQGQQCDFEEKETSGILPEGLEIIEEKDDERQSRLEAVREEIDEGVGSVLLQAFDNDYRQMETVLENVDVYGFVEEMEESYNMGESIDDSIAQLAAEIIDQAEVLEEYEEQIIEVITDAVAIGTTRVLRSVEFQG